MHLASKLAVSAVLIGLHGIQLSGMVSYHVFKTKDNQQIEIIGDFHKMPEGTAQNIVKRFTELLAKNHLPRSLPVVVELPDDVADRPAIATLAPTFAQFLQPSVGFSLIRADVRGIESDMINGVFAGLHDISDQAYQEQGYFDPETILLNEGLFEDIIERIKTDRAAGNPTITIAQALDYQYQIVEKLDSLRKKYENDAKMTDLIATAMLMASELHADVSKLLSSQDRNEAFAIGIVRQFIGKRSLKDFQILLEKLENCFCIYTDWVYANLYFLDTILDLLKQQRSHIVIIVGHSHAVALSQMLTPIGWISVTSKDIFDRVYQQRLEIDSNMIESFVAELLSTTESFLTTRCHVCSKETTKSCSKCRNAFYCTVACQNQAWPHHKKVCKVIAQ